MRTALHIFAFIALTSSHLLAEAPGDKPTETKALLSVVSELQTLATRQTNHYPTGQVAKQIDTLVDRAATTDQLARLAIISHAIAWPQFAEHAAHDGVFDYAMWQCARRIASRPGSEPASALRRLHPIIGPDGGASLMMKQLIAAQEKITERP